MSKKPSVIIFKMLEKRKIKKFPSKFEEKKQKLKFVLKLFKEKKFKYIKSNNEFNNYLIENQYEQKDSSIQFQTFAYWNNKQAVPPNKKNNPLTPIKIVSPVNQLTLCISIIK